MSEDYDEVTRLLLRLSHVEAQRDAFESALRKEVLAVIREEIRRAFSPKTIEATWIVSPEDAERIKARLERENEDSSR